MDTDCLLCGKKTTFFTRHEYRSGFICKDCYKKLKQGIKAQMKEHKKQIFSLEKVYFDFESKQVLINQTNKIDIRNFNELKSIEPFQKEHGETKKHTLTRATVGGVLFGGVGAVVGALSGGKEYKYIDELGLKITFTDGLTCNIKLITTQTKSDSFTVNTINEEIRVLSDRLTPYIMENNKEQDSSKNDNDIEELKKLKQLVDDGVITQEDFEAKKKQVLGL